VINPGEELCICYSADESKLWFIPQGQSTSSQASPPQADAELPHFEDWFEEDSSANSGSLAEGSVSEREKRSQQSVKWRRRQKALDKVKRDDGEESVIHAPRPIAFNANSSTVIPSSTSSTPVSEESSNTSNNTSLSSEPRTFDIPSYPCLPDDVIADLPVPLHSDKKTKAKRHVHADLVQLTEDLEWTEDDWLNQSMSASTSSMASTSSSGTAVIDPAVFGEDWVDVERIKGPAEVEEDAELYDEGFCEFLF